jgi:hypothetical protein
LNPRNYIVVSRELSAVDVILDDGTGPLEYWREVLYVRARSRRAAKGLAVKTWRRRRSRSWRHYGWLDDGASPFTGMHAHEAANDIGEESDPVIGPPVRSPEEDT